MIKLSGEKSKKIIYFKMYRSKIDITQSFILIPMQKPFLISTIIFKSNCIGNGNGKDYLNLAFLAENGVRTKRSEKNWSR